MQNSPIVLYLTLELAGFWATSVQHQSNLYQPSTKCNLKSTDWTIGALDAQHTPHTWWMQENHLNTYEVQMQSSLFGNHLFEASIQRNRVRKKFNLKYLRKGTQRNASNPFGINLCCATKDRQRKVMVEILNLTKRVFSFTYQHSVSTLMERHTIQWKKLHYVNYNWTKHLSVHDNEIILEHLFNSNQLLNKFWMLYWVWFALGLKFLGQRGVS